QSSRAVAGSGAEKLPNTPYRSGSQAQQRAMTEGYWGVALAAEMAGNAAGLPVMIAAISGHPLLNAVTHAASQSEPLPATMSAEARSSGQACLSGRSGQRASKTSAMATMRAAIGMSVPDSRSG